ncbi:MAG TPA: SDR family NAD(P)-dependent oxidoreductase [Bacteroidia bacterium]|nr:SDR family NAD(P)-dependent oxidoreductase [Bacteroidia bacterium]
MTKTVWVIGASSGLGRQLSEQLAERKYKVVISSRNERDLDVLCNHLTLTTGAETFSFPIDLSNLTNELKARQMVNEFISKFGYPEASYFVSGVIHDEDFTLKAASYLPILMQVNFLAPALLISEVAGSNPGVRSEIIVASTVAASRPRGKNIAYGTAKRALEQYCSGLMHGLAGGFTAIRVYRLGYMDTNLSYGQKLLFKPASTAKIAKALLSGSHKKEGIYYLPRFWQLITFILNCIPFAIYKKMKF